jgi:hypothetical protein
VLDVVVADVWCYMGFVTCVFTWLLSSDRNIDGTLLATGRRIGPGSSVDDDDDDDDENKDDDVGLERRKLSLILCGE